MQLIADLHLHSKYSRAVSPQMVIPEMVKWAKLKGINLLGTGDFTHPLWFSELKQYLEEEGGVLKIKEGGFGDIKFLLTTEISSIYGQGGRTRKIHNLIIAPSFAVVEKINTEFKKRGCNLISDGRPIVGLSAKQVADLVFSVDESCLLIPCHVWTPWFSLYGANSGFDSLEECFGELSKYIYAVETGLSSDPEMNWQIADLDNRSIVSFSDAHSPAKLGREATVFETPDIKILGYRDIKEALIGGGGETRISHTIEFYPEEGKYHYTGHRNCGVVQSPEETEKRGTTCTVCGRKLTVGVMERVRKLSKSITSITSTTGIKGVETKVDEFGVKWIKKESRPPFIRLVPLAEIIAESKGVGDASVSVIREYQNLIEKLGNEIGILMKCDLEKIARIGGEKLAEGVLKVRAGDIFIKPGFDGEYGKVSVWPSSTEASSDAKAMAESADKGSSTKEQMSMF